MIGRGRPLAVVTGRKTTVHSSHRARHSAAMLLASISLKLLRLGWLYGRLGVLCAIEYAPRLLPCLLRRIAVLGVALCFVFEFALREPDFPFWLAMRIPIVSLILLALHRAFGLVTRPASR